MSETQRNETLLETAKRLAGGQEEWNNLSSQQKRDLLFDKACPAGGEKTRLAVDDDANIKRLRKIAGLNK